MKLGIRGKLFFVSLGLIIVSLAIADAYLTRELEADFEQDERRCVPFSVDEYRSRNVLTRFADSTARLCSPLL